MHSHVIFAVSRRQQQPPRRAAPRQAFREADSRHYRHRRRYNCENGIRGVGLRGIIRRTAATALPDLWNIIECVEGHRCYLDKKTGSTCYISIVPRLLTQFAAKISEELPYLRPSPPRYWCWFCSCFSTNKHEKVVIHVTEAEILE